MILCKTSSTFLCSKDFLRITDGMGRVFDYCGNKTGQNVLVTGDKVEMKFRSDDRAGTKRILFSFHSGFRR